MVFWVFFSLIFSNGQNTKSCFKKKHYLCNYNLQFQLQPVGPFQSSTNILFDNPCDILNYCVYYFKMLFFSADIYLLLPQKFSKSSYVIMREKK